MPLTWYVEGLTTDEVRTEYGVRVEDESVQEREVGGAGKAGVAGRRRRQELLRRLPASVERRARLVRDRFKEDWKVVDKVWVCRTVMNSLQPRRHVIR